MYLIYHYYFQLRHTMFYDEKLEMNELENRFPTLSCPCDNTDEC